MPLYEFRGSVTGSIFASEYGKTLQMAPDVIGELFHRLVALLRLFAKRLRYDIVKVTRKAAGERFRGHSRRTAGSSFSAPDGVAGSFRLAFRNHLRNLERRAALAIVSSSSGEKLE